MEAERDLPLPSLAPHLKLARAPDEKGEPVYTLYNPAANAYYKTDWIAFECISRMPFHQTALALKNAVERETTLTISLTDIENVIAFLNQNALLSIRDQKIQNRAAIKMPLWKKIFHQYLYFSLPLFKPQAFLESTYPRIRWIHHPLFLKSMMIFLFIMIVATLPRIDEFFHTFSAMISAEGAIMALIVLSFVKIVHEFAHAYTAVRYGVKIPHMGIAFMVMYPVLYTETTGSWALSSRRARFHIGFAGIMAELCLAAVFLVVWHLSPPGSMAQSLAFLVVSISLVSSLLVNLNPFMRFDGYYMFSDASGFDNLQSRSCAFARHALRKALFGLNDAPPEPLPGHDQKFLTAFGTCLLIYRFFLFTGIAVLVYHIFFQPLGFILMMAELIWFIFLPILSEMKIWWHERSRIMASPRTVIPAVSIVLSLLVILVPWKTTIALPAVVHAGLHKVVYPPSPSRIVHMMVQEGQSVTEGDIVAELDSPDLDFNIRIAQQELDKLETLRRRGQSMVQTLQNNELSDVAIEKARLKLAAYLEQKGRLSVKAPFTGIIRDKNADMGEGRYVTPTDALFTIVDPATTTITAYATEDAREKIKQDATGVFVSQFRTTRLDDLSVRKVSETGSTAVEWPELVSVHGGPIAADAGADNVITARRTLYEITADASRAAPPLVERGYLHVTTNASSIFINWIKGLANLIRQEA